MIARICSDHELSPYVIAMQRLKISGLPHLVNALIITSIVSAGNGLLYSATRTLHGMSLEGHAPKVFSYCTKKGVPLWALCFSLCFCLLAFLQVKSSSVSVLTYLVDLVTCCQMLNYGFTAFAYRHFYAALKKQGVSRDTLPYKGKFQPYTSYMAMGGTLFMLLAGGYDVFLKGGWSVKWFFLDYAMIGFFIIAFVFWKVVFKSTYVRPGNADLSLGGLKEEIDAYEAMFIPRKSGRIEKMLFE
jgi:amino acid transporter